jgi:hypothetical protein
LLHPLGRLLHLVVHLAVGLALRRRLGMGGDLATSTL